MLLQFFLLPAEETSSDKAEDIVSHKHDKILPAQGKYKSNKPYLVVAKANVIMIRFSSS